MELVFIHGANATSKGWNYISPFFKDYDKYFVEYDCLTDFHKNLERIAEDLEKHGKIFLVSHSLGGIYGHYLQSVVRNVVGGCSIATPYGGSTLSSILKMFFPSNKLFQETCVTSPIIKGVQRIRPHSNWHQIVCSTARTSYPFEPNDGLITKSSQMKINGVKFHEIDDCHHEVLQNEKTVNIIGGILDEYQQR